MKKIPLRNRKKELVGYAIVDDDVYAEVGHLIWHMNSSGYAVRNVYPNGNTHPPKSEKLARRVLGLTPGDSLEAEHRDRNIEQASCNLNARILDKKRSSTPFNRSGRSCNGDSPGLACSNGGFRNPKKSIPLKLVER